MATDRTVSARSAEAITKGDSGSGAANGEVTHCRALYVGGAGNVKVDMKDVGTAITLVDVPAGSLLPIEITRIYSTDTTASDFVVFY